MIVIYEKGAGKWLFELTGDIRYTSNRDQAKRFINEVDAKKYASSHRHTKWLLDGGHFEFQPV